MNLFKKWSKNTLTSIGGGTKLRFSAQNEYGFVLSMKPCKKCRFSKNN
jgi:hypothetical protein